MNRGIIEHSRLGAGALKREQFLTQLTQESIGGKISDKLHLK